MFNQPSGGGTYFKPADHNGHLILITEVHTAKDKYDELRKKDMLNLEVDLIDLDEEDGVLGRVILVHPAITNKVKVGDLMVLARIGTVKTKQGKDAFSLAPFTDEDAKRAETWVLKNQDRPKFAPPAPIKGDDPDVKVKAGKKADDNPFA